MLRRDGGFEGTLAVRACEWLGRWIKREARPWRGPAEVVIYARKLIIALPVGGPPVDFEAPKGERYRMRIAPAESPPVTLHAERDDGFIRVQEIVYVPASLAYAGHDDPHGTTGR